MAIDGTLTNWDMNNKHVQPGISESGIAVQASSVLVGMGPPKLTKGKPALLTVGNYNENKTEAVYACGLIENVAIGQNKQINQFFEIGSKLRYTVPGRTMNSLTISRLYLDGPSLLKVLYAYYKNPKSTTNTDITIPDDVTGAGNYNIDSRNKPGFNDMWLNLASELFDYPIGMLLYFRDNKKREKGAIYLENCYLANHNFGLSATSTLFSESVSMQFDRIRPIELKSSVLAAIIPS